MQISVECGGFTRAADACLTANQTAAVLTQALAARLGHHCGMAGNDATSATFARAYDSGAHESLAALADLTHAFIGAGRLLEATGAEHAAAESASAGVRTAAYVGGGLADSYVRVQPPQLPPSVGGQEPSLGTVDAWILDQVEGFVWPSADVDGLRSAAAEWRRAAAATAGLVDHLEAAVALVELQRSPEVPLAVDALTDLGSLVGDTAWELSSVATACEEYADAVEAVRERTRALLAEIAQMIVEGAAVSAIVTGLTGGLAGGAALGAAAARVRAQAPRFHALLTALRAGVTTAAARLKRAVDELVVIRSRLERFVRVPARGERGSMKPPGGWTRPTPGRRRPDVEDPKLNNYVEQLFKGVDNPRRTGDGTTMDAIRHELRTGETVHNRRHIIKGEETLRGLEKWLQNNPHAPASDRSLAQKLASELREALAS
ncbi:hypothetical protein SFC79_02595 [Nocardioides sp. S-58]|uniref:Uncharacterized protein n=2 Tax=Nocardioides TaxID=1839 RepID=A0ABU5K6W2_9ACTN|nr:hypothetical protein [Nocardioides sp. S-58]MDZ5660641.1 hypothetical protein [Nocardioides sp. S-58]